MKRFPEDRGRLAAALVIALALHGSLAMINLAAPFSPGVPETQSTQALQVSFVTAKAEAPVRTLPHRPDTAKPVKQERLAETKPALTSLPEDSASQQQHPAPAPLPLETREPVPERTAKKWVEKPAEDALPLPQRSGGAADRADAAQVDREQTGLIVPALPRYRDNPTPDYPQAARRRGYEGLVVLSVTVETDGRAMEVTVKDSSGHEVLDRAALDAVRRWRFDPATRRGVPCVMTVDVPVRFELREERW